MREIELSQGFVALVDDEDYDFLMQWNWYVIKRSDTLQHALRKNYRLNETIFVHRFILGLKFGDNKEVDHINGNGIDNRRHNLRLVTRRENNLNSKRSREASLIEIHGNRFRVRPFVNRTRINLGSFATYEEAAEAVRVFNRHD